MSKTNPREIQTNSLILAKNPQTNKPILALMEMVLDASKTILMSYKLDNLIVCICLGIGFGRIQNHFH
jgi:hypothetical protein